MKKSIRSLIAITGGATFALTPVAYAVTSHNACESGVNKNSLHCAYLSQSANNASGKFLKVKEIIQGHAASTTIFCAADSRHPLMSIPSYLWNVYQPGQKISWQFTQCADEDCSTGKTLFDDNFTVTKQGNVYSSGPKSAVEVSLDPNYGVACKADGHVLQKNHANDSSLQLRIDDAVDMMESIPPMMNDTLNILMQMRSLAMDAASGTYASSQLQNMDVLFQTYKSEIAKAQWVSTLQGMKKISGGDLSIHMGDDSYASALLQIGIPPTDINGLGLQKADILTMTDAYTAITDVDAATGIVEGALSFDKQVKR